MERAMYYDRMGRPITVDRWGELFSNRFYKILQQTDVGHDLTVSTVWLGIDHSMGTGDPVIFETLVLQPDYSEIDGRRYTNEDEALEGHKELVERYK